MYDIPLNIAIGQCYHQLWCQVIAEAVFDYVLYRDGWEHDTALTFLQRQENLDLVDLGLTTTQLMDILKHVNVREMKERQFNYYVRSKDHNEYKEKKGA